MAISDKKLVELVNTEFEDALGAPGGDISNERAEAFRYYMQEPFGNEEEGRSKLVTSDVADVVDGLMPSILRIFTTADNVVSFDPVGKEDVALAEQESDYVTHVFFKKNPSFEIMFYWTWDALVQKNGIVKCWWDESEEITQETYQSQPESAYFALLSDPEVDAESIETTEREITVIDQQTGTNVQEKVYDVKFRAVRKTGRICVENVPPDEYRISGDSRSMNPSGARMVGHEREVTRDELVALGIDKDIVAKLSESENSKDSTEKQARKNKSDDKKTSKSSDKSQDKVLVREAYIRVDDDGDGRAELMHIMVAVGHSEPLIKEPADRQPFHVICPHPLPHKHFGQSEADRHKQGQRTTSELVRQIHDNLYQTNRPGHIVNEFAMGENTMDDLLTVDLGRNVRVRGDVNAAAAPIVVPFTAGESFPMLEYWEKVKRSRSGIQDNGEGLSPDALKNIQQSVMAEANDLQRMKIEAIARIFAETGIKSLFLHIHELVRKHQQKAEVVKLRNEWVEVDPREWKHRRDMTVNIGLGIGTRDRNLIHLNAIKELQFAMIQSGGMGLTVTPQNIYRTAVEYVKNSRMSHPEFYFTDPGDKQAPPPNQEQMALQKQQQDLIQQQQQLEAEKRRLDQTKLQLQAQKQQQEQDVKVRELERKVEADKDNFTLEVQSLKNELLEIQKKYSTTQAKPTGDK